MQLLRPTQPAFLCISGFADKRIGGVAAATAGIECGAFDGVIYPQIKTGAAFQYLSPSGRSVEGKRKEGYLPLPTHSDSCMRPG